MNKKTGRFIVECYNKWGTKKKSVHCGGFISGITVAQEWESKKKGRTAILSRILYNTKDGITRT